MKILSAFAFFGVGQVFGLEPQDAIGLRFQLISDSFWKRLFSSPEEAVLQGSYFIISDDATSVHTAKSDFSKPHGLVIRTTRRIEKPLTDPKVIGVAKVRADRGKDDLLKPEKMLTLTDEKPNLACGLVILSNPKCQAEKKKTTFLRRPYIRVSCPAAGAAGKTNVLRVYTKVEPWSSKAHLGAVALLLKSTVIDQDYYHVVEEEIGRRQDASWRLARLLATYGKLPNESGGATPKISHLKSKAGNKESGLIFLTADGQLVPDATGGSAVIGVEMVKLAPMNGGSQSIFQAESSGGMVTAFKALQSDGLPEVTVTFPGARTTSPRGRPGTSANLLTAAKGLAEDSPLLRGEKENGKKRKGKKGKGKTSKGGYQALDSS